MDILLQCRAMVECDTARIIRPLDTFYLIIGFKKNTRDCHIKVYQNGTRIDYDYIEERAIASGKTEMDLLASVQDYVEMSSMTIEQYLDRMRRKRGT